MKKVFRRIGRAALVLVALLSTSVAQQAVRKPPIVTPIHGSAIERYLDSIRHNPQLLLEFARAIPKGGDLHNHLTGSAYAESLINYAVRDNICIDTHTFAAVARDIDKPEQGKSPCDETKNHVAAGRVSGDPVLYRRLIDAWSMRDFVAANGESAHDHFFDTFGKFSAAKNGHTADILAEVVSR